MRRRIDGGNHFMGADQDSRGRSPKEDDGEKIMMDQRIYLDTAHTYIELFALGGVYGITKERMKIKQSLSCCNCHGVSISSRTTPKTYTKAPAQESNQSTHNKKKRENAENVILSGPDPFSRHLICRRDHPQPPQLYSASGSYPRRLVCWPPLFAANSLARN